MLKYLLVALIIGLSLGHVSCKCTKDIQLGNCWLMCNKQNEFNYMECTYRFNFGDHMDFEHVITNISKQLSQDDKLIETLYITDYDYAQEFNKANILKDLLFDRIIIRYSPLVTIDDHAFDGTSKITRLLQLESDRQFNSSNLFKVINKMENLYTLYLDDINLEEVPDYAFSGNHRYLSNIEMDPIRKIGTRAFSKLSNLTELKINSQTWCDQSVLEVSDYAFAMDQRSYLNLNITFNGCEGFYDWNLTRAFSEKALQGINRPVNLQLSTLKVMKENVFRPFFEDNDNNQVVIKTYFQSLDCNDCDNQWITKDDNIVSRVKATCDNKKPLNSPDNFKHCS